MMVFAYILIVGLAAFCLYLLSRVGELEERIEVVIRELSDDRSRATAPEPVPTVVPPVPIIPIPVRQPEARQMPPPLPVQEIPRLQPAVTYQPEQVLIPATPTLAERLRNLLGDEEWETLVGGSLLNKLGALILVIGLALFLGFSFGHMTPAGRAAIAICLSVGVLGAGVWVERRQRYQVFARGLIGAGWAGLYATAYAVYALPEARIIQSPFIGSLGLLAVATGMIAHSLRYKAQAVTGVAYFAAFAALAATPSSPFAVVSLIPLAASVLFLAVRFDWYSMALFGVAATYLTCISRGDSGAPLRETQSLFLVYWLLFETFDLLRTKRRVSSGGVEWIYPLNLAAFLGLSYFTWSHHAPERLWLAAAAGSALLLADAIARAFLRAPGGDLPESLRAGSFESSAFVSALLGGLAIVGRVPGLWMSAGLAVEAEVLYLAGVRFNSAFLRRVGISAFVHSMARLFWEQPVAKSDVLGHSTWNQTPPALLHAVFFYLNRALRTPNVLMSSAAAALVAGVIAAEVPIAFTGMAWVLFGLALFEIGLRLEQRDFRAQSYAFMIGGMVLGFWPATAVSALAVTLAAVYGCALRTRWVSFPGRDELASAGSASSIALAAMLLWRTMPVGYAGLAWCGLALVVLELGMRGFAAELRIFFAPAGVLAIAGLVFTQVDHFEKFPTPPVWISFFGAALMAGIAAVRGRGAARERDGAAGVGVVAALAGIWLVVPDPYVSLVWTAFALAVLEAGMALPLPSLRRIALLPFAAVYYRGFSTDLETAPLRVMPVAIAGLYWAWYRLRQEVVARAIFWLALIPLLALLEKEAGFGKAPLGWMAVSLVLLVAGTRFEIPDAKIQSYLVGALAFGCAVVAGSPWWSAVGVVAGLYAAQFVANKLPDARASRFFSVGGTLLLAAVLFREVSGSLFTVSLGLEGLALLGCGFGLRERVLRLQGLALLLVCILKLFVYDLRNLETMYRILSFVALGLILLGVSWIYTRFREHVRKLL